VKEEARNEATINEATLVEFYRAFGERNAAGMAACYHTSATFSDPVFGRLSRTELETMWYMLCERGKDLNVTLNHHTATEREGSAQWTAVYTFSTTGRLVRNVVASKFLFRDGKISEQADDFDLWRWTRMALGTTGRLLGWTPLVQNSVRRKARASLDHYTRS
jgi:ketosteroid isomerase-like protein